ncbi:MAG TPA: YbhB/YbcL family Raf kinase inhibitor-like protein [Allosphingosinicella sp.]|jgi:Raf kinase inhibitor-like YbhB/YbcL family protein
MRHAFLFACLLAFAGSSAAAAPAPADRHALAGARSETRTDSTFQLSSRDFQDGGEIPIRFSANGDGLSPSLAWSGLPEGTRTLAVMMEDPEGVSSKPFVHWLAWNIDPAAGGLSRGSVTLGARLGKNSRGTPSYLAPRPGTPHKYHFQVFALDKELALKAGSNREQLLAAMNGHVLAKADLVGTFTRRK